MVEDIEGTAQKQHHSKNKMSFLKEFECYEKSEILKRYHQATNEDERPHSNSYPDTTEVELCGGNNSLFRCCGSIVYNNSNEQQ